jgi:hypothetical protein
MRPQLTYHLLMVRGNVSKVVKVVMRLASTSHEHDAISTKGPASLDLQRSFGAEPL